MQAFNEIRGDNPDLPLVIITGNAAIFTSPIMSEGMRAADARLAKSTSLVEISGIIDRLLD